eukprot:m.94214 g.94214  ORF g.94214 m.94214 type:complete len:65 (-) comp12216_c0_seq1:29-223(-)
MARSTPRQKSERTEYELVDQLYEANTKVEALLGVKKALEMDVQLYQVGPRACFPSLLYYWAVCS